MDEALVSIQALQELGHGPYPTIPEPVVFAISTIAQLLKDHHFSLQRLDHEKKRIQTSNEQRFADLNKSQAYQKSRLDSLGEDPKATLKLLKENLTKKIINIQDFLTEQVKGLEKKIDKQIENSEVEIGKIESKLRGITSAIVQLKPEVVDIIVKTKLIPQVKQINGMIAELQKQLILRDTQQSFEKVEERFQNNEESIKVNGEGIEQLSSKNRKRKNDHKDLANQHIATKTLLDTLPAQIKAIQLRIVELQNDLSDYKINVKHEFKLNREHIDLQYTQIIQQKKEDLSQIYSDIDSIKQLFPPINDKLHELFETIDKNFDENQEAIQITSVTFNEILQENYSMLISEIKKIQTRISWFPTNDSKMREMSPTEARIYTIETRLRTEENKRIDEQVKLKQDLNHVKESLDVISPSKYVQNHRIYSARTSNTKSYTHLNTINIQNSVGGMGSMAKWKKPKKINQTHTEFSLQSLPLRQPEDQSSQLDIDKIYRDFSPSLYGEGQPDRPKTQKTIRLERQISHKTLMSKTMKRPKRLIITPR